MADSTSAGIVAAMGLSETFSCQLQMTVRRLELLVDELLEKQQNMIKYLETINGQVSKEESTQKVHITMLHTHQYYKKLLHIRKDIMEMCSKSAKLKVRAQKLYLKQEEEARIRQRKMEEQEERDRMLIAKPANDGSKP